jgi:hypothetical protein
MITLIILWRILVKLEPSCKCPLIESLVGLLTSLVGRRSSDHVVTDMVLIILLTYVLWADGALVLSNNVLWADVALRLLICVLLMTLTWYL